MPMFAKKLFKKSAPQQPASTPSGHDGHMMASDLNIRVVVHHGIPSTASALAFDPIQSLLAVGTLDGRIKVIGGNNIESILVSSHQSPFKYLEFILNQGLLTGISNENEIQVWDLQGRQPASNLQWESNITAFSVIHGTGYMYIGDEYGMVSVLKYDVEAGELIQLPYHIPLNVIAEAAEVSSPIDYPIVGVLPQPCSQGNRLLVAFSNGLLVLWDAFEDRVILVRGNKGPSLSETADGSQEGSQNALSDLDIVGKEITSLCWASTNGSVLAVGYVDGDILFWDFLDVNSVQKTKKSSNNVVKLQLSSEERRLPVIVMHWLQDNSNSCGGKLFIYGGDVVGSEEVLTILNLNWPFGIESLKCVGRVDMALDGSFADMVVSPVVGSMSGRAVVFLLTNPGRLQFLDESSLTSSNPKPEKNSCVSPKEYPKAVLTMEPQITVSHFGLLNVNDDASRAFSEVVSDAKFKFPDKLSAANEKWPLTGGIPSELSTVQNYLIEKLFIAGYADGSVRIWDATYPVLSLIYRITPEVKSINVVMPSAAISALDLCTKNMCLAIGNESGTVLLYSLKGCEGETNLSYVTNANKQVHVLHQEDGPQCIAIFTFPKYPVSTLKFADRGRKTALGFRCGRVAVLDISTHSVLFLTESLADSSCPIMSLSMLPLSNASVSVDNLSCSESEQHEFSEKLVMLAMTKDANIFLLDGDTGNVLSTCSKNSEGLSAISMHIIEGGAILSRVYKETNESNSLEKTEAVNKDVVGAPSANVSDASAETERCLKNVKSLILLCCEDALRLYSAGSLPQGSIECIQKVQLPKACFWTAVFKEDEKHCWLALLYRTGTIEIRCLPTLEVLIERDLVSLLRWNFKNSVSRTICSTDRGHVTMINGPELAILSLLAHENDFRIPESLPCLHDKVVAAAAEAAFRQILSQNKKQEVGPRILGGIFKGFRSKAIEQKPEREWIPRDSAHLDTIFSNSPCLKPSEDAKDDEEAEDLNIDDVIIDEPVTSSSSSDKGKKEKTGREREMLFEGACSGEKPKMRSVDEIKAKYRKGGDVSAVASQAKDKLLERQEKLERLSERTQELQSGAENFATMAQELAKQMEKRKWWNL